MYTIRFIWAKLLKKCRGAAVRNAKVHPTSKVGSGSAFVNSSMDKYSFCGYDCQIINCEIGKYCSIADDVKIGGARHPIEWVGMSPVFYSGYDSVKKKYSNYDRDKDKYSTIGNDVWIGANAVIIQGVNIGDGVVIGAGSVVTKDVPPYAIVAGNPAKLIRMRFSEDIIKQLEDIKWWELDDKQMSICAVYIKEPMKFIDIVKSIKK